MFLGKDKRYWYDVVERVASTFVVAFLAVWFAPVLNHANIEPDAIKSLLNLDILEKAALAGLAAVITLGKTLFAGFVVGSRRTASLLPLNADPAAPKDVN